MTPFLIVLALACTPFTWVLAVGAVVAVLTDRDRPNRGRRRGMRPKKPCAQCAHGKSKHRKRECRHTWQTTGQTFMGNRIITKWCSCDGYKETTSE